MFWKLHIFKSLNNIRLKNVPILAFFIIWLLIFFITGIEGSWRTSINPEGMMPMSEELKNMSEIQKLFMMNLLTCHILISMWSYMTVGEPNFSGLRVWWYFNDVFILLILAFKSIIEHGEDSWKLGVYISINDYLVTIKCERFLKAD